MPDNKVRGSMYGTRRRFRLPDVTVGERGAVHQALQGSVLVERVTGQRVADSSVAIYDIAKVDGATWDEIDAVVVQVVQEQLGRAITIVV